MRSKKRDAAPVALQAKQSWQDKVIGAVCVLFCLLLIYSMVVGVIAIGHWIFR